MSMISHQPALQQRLAQAIKYAPDTLGEVMRQLSHKDRRAADRLLAATLLPQVPEDRFWSLFAQLVGAEPKAYLGTFLKVIAVKYRQRELRLEHPVLAVWAEKQATAIDRQKFLEVVLPLPEQPEAVAYLLDIFGAEAVETRLIYLYKADTLPAYYLLFNQLKQFDGDHALLNKYFRLLQRKETPAAQQLAALMNDYFDLRQPVPPYCSRVEPFRLSKVDESFVSFCHVLKNI